MTPSKILVVSAAGLLAGVATESFAPFLWGVALTVFLLGLLLIMAGGRTRPTIALLGVFLLFFLLGFARASFEPLSLPADSANLFSGARASLISRAGEVISGAEHAVFSAMVLGDKTLLSVETKEAFSRTGTRHIIAISGMHLTIVAVLLWQFLISAGLWRRQAFWGALAGIVLFVLLVGSPPSAVRAGIMAVLYLLARHVGRPSAAWRLLLAAAAAMVLVNPELLIFSVGFQLSFLAVLGIIFFKPFFDRLLGAIRWEGLRALLSMSLAAQLTTWPIVAVNFGMFSTVGVFANLVVVPFLPLVMILGLGFLAVGWWSLTLAKIFLWPIWIVLRGINVFVSALAAWPNTAVSVTSFAPSIFIFYYAALVAFLVVFKKRLDHEISV